MTEKKTRPTVGDRPVPVTVLADVLMDEAHKAARRRKLDLTDREAAQRITDEVLAGKVGGELGKAFAKWLRGEASSQQKETWPKTFRSYLVKYWKAGGVPNAAEKRAKLQELKKPPVKPTAAEKTSAKKATARKSAAKKTTAKGTGRKKTTNSR